MAKETPDARRRERTKEMKLLNRTEDKNAKDDARTIGGTRGNMNRTRRTRRRRRTRMTRRTTAPNPKHVRRTSRT